MITITYTSYVQPVLDYGRERFSTASDNVCNALDKVQNKTRRLIIGEQSFHFSGDPNQNGTS